MSEWSEGWGWEPSGQDDKTLWGEIDAGVGYPDVYIDGINYCDVISEVSWRSGREWWFTRPEGGTGQVILYGWLDNLHAGQKVVISAAPIGPLWTGWVDTVALEAQPDGNTTHVTLVDVLGKMGEVDLVDLRGLAFGQQPLDRRVIALAQYVGTVASSSVEAADTFLPDLKAQPTFKGNLLELLARNEEASNAIVAVDTDGNFLIQPRAALSGPEPPITWLENEACPTSVIRSRASTDRIINSWQLGLVGGASIVGNDPPASINAYGRHTYNVEDYLAPFNADTNKVRLYTTTAGEESVYFAGVIGALTVPVDTMTAEVRVLTRTNPVVALHLFDWIVWSGLIFQVMSMDWEASGGEWTVLLGLDPTQQVIGGRPVDPEPPEPPTTTIVTETWTCKADGYAALTSGGLNAGNGGSDDLLLGRLADGTIARGFINFNATWTPSKVVRVISAKVVLHTTTYVCMTAGSRRNFTIQRVAASWSEGTYAVHCGFASSNGLKYPGPAVTSSGERDDVCPAGDSATWDIDVLAIARAWASGSPNYGIRIRASSETSSSDRAEVYSRHHATSARRPTLVITYEKEV